MRVGEVRVRVPAAKVGRRHAVLDGSVWEAEFAKEECAGVGASDTVKAIEENLEGGSGLEERTNEIEIEDGLEKDNVVFGRVDDLYFEWAVILVSDFREIDLRSRRGHVRFLTGDVGALTGSASSTL